MSFGTKAINAAVVVLTITAGISVATRLQRAFAAPTTGVTPNAVADWRRLGVGRVPIGPASAAVSIVVFSDIRCPHCAIAWQSIDGIRKDHPGDVSVVYRHYPLTWGVYSADGARASECAARKGKLAALFEVLNDPRSKTDSTLIDHLVKGDWTDAAIRAGVLDTLALKTCMSDPAVLSLIKEDIDLAHKLNVTGVPTLFVNGTKVVGDDKRVLSRVVASELRKRSD
jgi:protein-disulfide isomerase